MKKHFCLFMLLHICSTQTAGNHLQKNYSPYNQIPVLTGPAENKEIVYPKTQIIPINKTSNHLERTPDDSIFTTENWFDEDKKSEHSNPRFENMPANKTASEREFSTTPLTKQEIKENTKKVAMWALSVTLFGSNSIPTQEKIIILQHWIRRP